MATKTMINEGAHYFHKETVGADTTSDPVIITDVPGRQHIAVVVSPTSNATVQFSISPRKLIEEDANSATWYDWAPGIVTAKTADGTEYPITAARLATSGGQAEWEIRI